MPRPNKPFETAPKPPTVKELCETEMLEAVGRYLVATGWRPLVAFVDRINSTYQKNNTYDLVIRITGAPPADSIHGSRAKKKDREKTS